MTDTFTVEGGGFRAGGKNYEPGSQAPIKYRTQLQTPTRPRDPAGTRQESPPNFGRTILPHIVTFSGLASTLSRSYRTHDEAIRHSVQNAHMMLNDPLISGPVFARQRMVSLLNWSIESEDDNDPRLKAAAQTLTDILTRTHRFTEYRRCLSEAIWYGRYAIMHRYGRRIGKDGRPQYYIKDWTPVSGDKLVFRYDDGVNTYDPDGVGIKVSPAHVNRDILAGSRTIEYFAEGTAVFLERWERNRVAIHKHMVRDGEYEDPLTGSQIHGVGLRNFLYWVWYQKQEAMAQLTELVELTSRGFTVYYYPSGNDEYRDEMKQAAEERAHTNIILIPYDENAPHQDPIQTIPADTGGMQMLMQLIDDFYNDMITRFVLGQTLSTKAAATGLGSGVADLHHDSLLQVIKYDAVNLEETITNETLRFLRDVNLPEYRNHEFYFRIQTDSNIPKEQLEAILQGWQIGLKMKSADVYDKIGMSVPQEDDDVVYNPQVVQMMEQAENGGGMMPGMPPGMNPMGGPEPGALGSADNPIDMEAIQGGDGASTPMPGEEEDPEQMAKNEDPAARRRKLFGPILNKKTASPDPDPSDAQKEAGNYRVGRIKWKGLDISIENEKGSIRKGKGWEQEMTADYGYIRTPRKQKT